MDPLYVFVHIPKTGGTTLIKNITRNLRQDECLEINIDTLKVDAKVDRKKYQEAFEKLVNKNGRHLNNLKFIYGHTIPYGIHKFFQREVRYITFLRTPTKRIASQYNYLHGQYQSGLDKKLRERFKDIYFVKGKPRNFWGWYQNKFLPENQDLALLSTYQILNKLGYVDSKSKSLRDFEKDLNKFYFIGIYKNYAKDSLYLYHQFEMKKYFFSENISRKVVDINKNKKMKLQIKKDYLKSNILFQAGLNFNKAFIKKHPEYWQIIRKEKIKQTILMPITQTLYNPLGLAKWLRRTLQN